VEEIERNGAAKDKHVEEPQNLKGGKHNTSNVETREQV
jgi:hypothetical protein